MMKRGDPDKSEPLVADVDAGEGVDAGADVDAGVAGGEDAGECQQNAPAGEDAASVEGDESAAESGANEGIAEDEDVGEDATASEDRKRRLPRVVVGIIALVALVFISGGVLLLASYVGSDSPAPPASQPGITEPGGVTTIPGSDVPKTSGNGDSAVDEDDGDVDTDDADDGTTGTDSGNTADPPAVSGDSGGSNDQGSTPGSPGGTSGGATDGGTGGGGGGTGGVWHAGWNEWVVDMPGHYERRLVHPAWNEELGHYGSICWDCGAEVTGNLLAHAEETGHMGGSYFGWISEGTAHHEATYEDVWVPEQGHNVWHEGYWE